MKTKDKSNVSLVLEGNIYLVEYDKKGKEVSKEKLDPELMLSALAQVIKEGLYLLDNKND